MKTKSILTALKKHNIDAKVVGDCGHYRTYQATVNDHSVTWSDTRGEATGVRVESLENQKRFPDGTPGMWASTIRSIFLFTGLIEWINKKAPSDELGAQDDKTTVKQPNQ